MARPINIDDLFAIAVPSSPVLSPDGLHIVYVLTQADRDVDQSRRSLWRVSTTDGASTRITFGHDDTSPCFAPNGDIAFLREVDERPQVFVLQGADEPRQVTTLKGGAGSPSFSANGQRIAFSSAVQGDEIGPTAPLVADRVNFKRDGRGRLGDLHQQLFIVEAAGGVARQLTHGNFQAGDPSFSPDDSFLAFTASLGEDADINFRSSAYLLPLDEPASEPRKIGTANYVDTSAGFVDERLLVIGRQEPAVANNHLLLLSMNEPDVDLTASLDRNIMPGSVAYPGGIPGIARGGRILFVMRDQGSSHLYSSAADGTDHRGLITGTQQVVAGLSTRPNLATAAVVLVDGEHFGEVAIVDIVSGGLRVLTSHSSDSLPGVRLFQPVARSFNISDGVTVHGWVIHDPDQSRAGPLLLDIHGGPHNAWAGVADSTHLYQQVLVSRGWSILLLNPRGSDGYGEEFLTGVNGAWGDADANDFLEPIDQLVAEGLADPNRLALAGYSYGGYMACYLTGTTNRFSSAVAGGLICDLAQMDGTSDTGLELAALELGISEAARDALSPLRRIGDVSTPTLILHGANDNRCPVDQAERWFAGLRVRGVATRLVMYPSGSHLFFMTGRPSHRADYNSRIIDWVETYA